MPEGSTVTIFYSDGPEEVPDVIGEQQERRRADPARRRLRAVDVVETTDTTEPRGHRGRAEPEGGEEAAEGSTVTIVVSAFEEEPSEIPTDTESPTETTSPTCRPTPPTTGRPGAVRRALGSASAEGSAYCQVVRPS